MTTTLALATALLMMFSLASTTQAVAQDDGPSGSGGKAAKVDKQVLEEVADEDTTTFWVYLDDKADLKRAAALTNRKERGRQVVDELTATARASQANLKRLLKNAGAKHQSFWIANAIQVTGDADLVDRIAKLPEVAQIAASEAYELPEPEVTAEEAQVDSVEWNIDRVNASAAWSEYGTTGEGIIIGSIDSGAMHDHPALVNSYRGNDGDGTFSHDYNWWDPSRICGSPSLEPCDNHGHGSHTIGTMVGNDGADNVIGVAPGSKWISAKGCEVRSCSDAALLSSGQFMLAPTDLNGQNPNPDLRPHVINNSWGGDATSDPWYQQTVQAWIAAGIFPQFANGNDGNACGTAGNPGNLAQAYSSGAFDVNGDIADFSSRGPSAWGADIVKPNIAAPGVAIRSALPGGTYAAWDGTSMASPHVAGAIALLWSAAPSLARDIDTTRALLDGSAIDVADLSCGGTADNNNVFGQGKLDVLAALDQAPTGPKGVLTGTVIDAETRDPLPGLTVTVGDDAQRTRVTRDDGTYVFENLPAGDYPVAVSTYGYLGQNVAVSITGDETTTQDFALEPADMVTVSGRVTDGDAHGWSLPAELTVDGVPVSTTSDQVTGEYEFEVPVGATYRVAVEPEYPGYGDATVTVDATSGDTTVDVALPVTQCHLAPGYHVDAKIGILGEYTGSHETPLATFLAEDGIVSQDVTWSDDVSQYDTIVVNNPSRPSKEEFLDFLDRTDAAGVGVVFLDVFWYSSGIYYLHLYLGNPASREIDGHAPSIDHVYYEVAEQHPVLEGFDVGHDIVMVDQTSASDDFAYFSGYEGDGRKVIARVGNSRDGLVGDGVGVQQRAANRHVLLSMHGVTSVLHGPRNWSDDGGQVFLNALEWTAEASLDCQPIDGGLVFGSVTDLNTGDPVRRTTVSGVDVPGDSDTSEKDGSYWFFSSVTGEREFVATHHRHAEATTTVEVAADGVTVADFTMAAGRLTVEPAHVSSTVRLGKSDEQTITITNTGTAPATIDVEGQQYASFAPLDGAVTPDEVTGEANRVREIRGQFSPDMMVQTEKVSSKAREPAMAPEPTVLAGGAWKRTADLPDSNEGHSTATVDGTVYSFGGRRDTTYAYDPETGEWSRRSDIPKGQHGAAAVTIDGKVYTAGGFGRDLDRNRLGYQRTLYIYDPEADTWSQGADMPAARGAGVGGRFGMGAAELDGRFYVVAGCTNPYEPDPFRGTCHPSDEAYVYDPATDHWGEIAEYPEKTSWLACGGLSGRLYCAGGLDDQERTDTAHTYAYDPASDSWSAVADMPYDNWGMSFATSGGRLVVSGGVSFGMSVVTNRGAAYDPATDTWTEIAPSNFATYRSSGACGFYKVGGYTVIDGFNHVVRWVDHHPGFDECESDPDAPWLAADVSDTTLKPGESITLTVSMDSAAAEEHYPGTYTSGVWFRHDTPYAVEPVGVTFEVKPPNNWGKISGTVTGSSCEDEQAPIDGATVHMAGRETDLTFVTGEDGSYTYWLPAGPKVTVATSKDGYRPNVEEVTVKPRRDVDTSATLTERCDG